MLQNERKQQCNMFYIWKMRRVRSENGMGSCLLHGEKENETHLLLKCTKTQRWSEKLLKSKWPNMKEETTLRQLLADNNENVIGRKIKIVFVLDQKATKLRKLKQM
jgi:hypothetical protein